MPERYAQYIAGYGAYDVYFLVAGSTLAIRRFEAKHHCE